MQKKNNKIFAERICFQKLVFVFLLACVLGAVGEEIYDVIKTLLRDGVLEWEYHRGVIYGPISPIYGFGAMLATAFLCNKKRPLWQVFLISMVAGTLFEYLMGLGQEIFIGTRSWNYDHKILNFEGMIALPYALSWGICGTVYYKWIYPFISKLVEKISIDTGNFFVAIIVIILSLDMLISWTALYRQHLRREGIPPKTYIGKYYDKVYTDQYLKKYFKNMKPVEDR